jgi:hypothetical protein
MCLNLDLFKNFALLSSRVKEGAGAAGAGAASKFYPEPEPHKNDTSPQHCITVD